MSGRKEQIESQIKSLISEWSVLNNAHMDSMSKTRYAGYRFGDKEYCAMMDAVFNGWLSRGKFTFNAEEKLATISSRKHAILCNSGSSANLLLISAAKQLYNWKDGDGVLTLACGFPTTVNPILQNNLKPYFIDLEIDTLAPDYRKIEKALKTIPSIKCVFIPHSLGFKFDIDEIYCICHRNGVKLFADTCDAYNSKHRGSYLQAYGDAATMSFYVAHDLSSFGEGGAVVTNDTELHKYIRSYRSWGVACQSDSCCIRSCNPSLFCPTEKLTKQSDLPDDYPVNYCFEFLGYNLKMLDIQAAVLHAQLDRLNEFATIRKNNYNKLMSFVKDLPAKTWELNNGISPFAFPLLVRSNAERQQLQAKLKDNNIESRVLFGGNLTKHPAFAKIRDRYEIIGSLENSDIIMNQFLMVGCSHVLGDNHIKKIGETIKSFYGI